MPNRFLSVVSLSLAGEMIRFLRRKWFSEQPWPMRCDGVGAVPFFAFSQNTSLEVPRLSGGEDRGRRRCRKGGIAEHEGRCLKMPSARCVYKNISVVREYPVCINVPLWKQNAGAVHCKKSHLHRHYYMKPIFVNSFQSVQ